MTFRPPAGCVVGDEAELDDGRTAAGAEHGCGPGAGVVSDQIEPGGGKNIGQVVDEFGGESRPEPGALDKAPPVIPKCVQAAALVTLSSAQSSNGERSPRPTCRASTGHRAPSSSCS